MPNPFFYGDPVLCDQFIGRRRELRRVAGRIAGGQSAAVVGEPRTGKTSLLKYLEFQAAAGKHGLDREQFFFSYLSAQALGDQLTPCRFWSLALRPLSPTIAQVFHAGGDALDVPTLESMLAQLGGQGRRMVLLLDEFDVLLHHPVLNSAEFWGGLRSLVSLNGGALVLVIASRQRLAALNEKTAQYSRQGSPFFNTLIEFTLEPWNDKDMADLLGRAGERFSAVERRFIADISGGHPYLAQAAAAALWEAYEDGERDPVRRREQTGRDLYGAAAGTLGDTWQVWPAPFRQALAAVALGQMPAVLGRREVLAGRLVRDASSFAPELRDLAKQGFVIEDAAQGSGWRVRPAAMLWWLADELIRVTRQDKTFEDWLRNELLVGPLTQGEWQQVNQAARDVAGLFQAGASAFIQAAAKGWGEAVVKK